MAKKSNNFAEGFLVGFIILAIPIMIFLGTKVVAALRSPNPTPTPSLTPVSTSSPKPTAKPTVRPVTRVSTPTPIPSNDPNAIVKCSISATCGGGLREMTKSECDKITCCQTSTGWIVTSKSNCDQTRISECKADAEKYRATGLTMCRSIYSNGGDSAAWNKCIDSIGQTANAEVAKCSQ